MSVDVVGIFDEEGAQLVPEGRPIKASVTEASKLLEHPLEDGSSVSDHRIFMPVEIEMTIICDFDLRQRYAAIYRDTETVTIQTNGGSFDSMCIESMSHDETAEVFDRLPIVLKFKEAVFVQAQFQALPAKSVAATGTQGKRNASTVKRGEQSGKPTAADAERKASVAYRAIFGGG